MKYDLIGDIHGHSEPLVRLLQKLDYELVDGIYRHPERSVIFLGDFIDRGPNQRDVISIVRPMIDGGVAQAVMGNHEFNAIAFFTPDPGSSGKFLRDHNTKYRGQHKAFLAEYERADDYQELVQWFRRLPLWLDLGALRIVHACWDERLMSELELGHGPLDGYLSDDLLIAASRRGSLEHMAIETLLKGKEIPLPNGQKFYDKDGNSRHEIRMKWWDAEATTYRDYYLGPDSALSYVPENPIATDHEIDFSFDDPPVFIGHYWLDAAKPKRLAPNVACLDYSVARKKGGKLVAYCWDGEQRIDNDKFVWVERAA
jgi:hypothetical protein